MKRRSDSGQVGVETALVMPMTVFMILGILQLSMMQQARLLTEYAAYRAVRSGSLNQLNCPKMTDAAVEGLLPSLGRTDSAAKLAAAWLHTQGAIPMANRTTVGLRIAELDYIVTAANGFAGTPYTKEDFDDPNHPLTLTAKLTYNYELRIPFANALIHEMWTGGNYFHDQMDQLVPASVNHADTGRQAAHAADRAKYKRGNRYFVPIVASYSMRMMSNLQQNGATQGKCP